MQRDKDDLPTMMFATKAEYKEKMNTEAPNLSFPLLMIIVDADTAVYLSRDEIIEWFGTLMDICVTHHDIENKIKYVTSA